MSGSVAAQRGSSTTTVPCTRAARSGPTRSERAGHASLCRLPLSAAVPPALKQPNPRPWCGPRSRATSHPGGSYHDPSEALSRAVRASASLRFSRPLRGKPWTGARDRDGARSTLRGPNRPPTATRLASSAEERPDMPCEGYSQDKPETHICRLHCHVEALRGPNRPAKPSGRPRTPRRTSAQRGPWRPRRFWPSGAPERAASPAG